MAGPCLVLLWNPTFRLALTMGNQPKKKHRKTTQTDARSRPPLPRSFHRIERGFPIPGSLKGHSTAKPVMELKRPGPGKCKNAACNGFRFVSFFLLSFLLGLAWLGLAWLGLAWLGLAWLGLAWLGLAWLGLAWLGLAWLGLAWLGLAWLGLAWLGLAWLGLAWLGLAWLGLAWLGLAWLGLAWLGLAWLGLAWLGFACLLACLLVFSLCFSCFLVFLLFFPVFFPRVCVCVCVCVCCFYILPCCFFVFLQVTQSVGELVVGGSPSARHAEKPWDFLGGSVYLASLGWWCGVVGAGFGFEALVLVDKWGLPPPNQTRPPNC